MIKYLLRKRKREIEIIIVRKSIKITRLIGKPECIESNKLSSIANFSIIRKSLMLRLPFHRLNIHLCLVDSPGKESLSNLENRFNSHLSEDK